MTTRTVPLERLRRSVDVQRALRQGDRRAGRFMAVHAFARPTGEEPTATRLTVIASRRVGGAVRRNRAKRLLREAARGHLWRGGLDVVLVARADCADSGLGEVGKELDRLAGLLDARPTVETRA